MEFVVLDHQIYLGESKAPIAEMLFPETEPGVYCITHTFVDPSMAGQGIAGKLVAQAVKTIHAKGGKVTATCSYAKSWLEKHPEALEEK